MKSKIFLLKNHNAKLGKRLGYLIDNKCIQKIQISSKFKSSWLIMFLLNLIILISNISCIGQNSDEKLEVESYRSYNNTTLPTEVVLTNSNSRYDSIIKKSQELIGLADSDIEIKTTNKFGAFSVINRKKEKRTLLYSPVFFDSIYSVTNSNLAIMSVCFHELAHHFYRHPLKSTASSHFHEKQADRYSGFQMCVIGATLEQTLAAIQHFGNEVENETHPNKASRIDEITKGYIDAKIKIFKDSTYLEMDKNFKQKEIMYAFNNTPKIYEEDYMEYSGETARSNENKAIAKSKNREVYILYGELIYFTSNHEIILISNNNKIGKIINSNENLAIKTLDIDGVKFQLDNDIIYTIYPDETKLEVGSNITK